MRNTVVLIVFGLALGVLGRTQAQSGEPKLKTYYYEDGSVFIGTVLSENAQQIILKGSTGDTLHINKALLRTKATKVKPPKSFYSKGFFGSLNASIIPAGQINLTLGHRINDKYSVGIGTGLHVYTHTQNGFFEDNSFLPVYIYGRRYLTSGKKVRPFVGLAVGYSFPLQDQFRPDGDEFNGGLYIQPELGLHFAGRRKSSFYMSIGQSFQQSSGSNSRDDIFFNPVIIDYNRWYSRTTFKIGVEFK